MGRAILENVVLIAAILTPIYVGLTASQPGNIVMCAITCAFIVYIVIVN